MKYIAFITLFITSITSADTLKAFEKKLSQYQGKVVYLDFWASWCGPCRQSFPWMNQMQTQFADAGFTVLSVNLDAKPELAKKFLDTYPANFPIFYDHKGKVAKALKVKGMPSSYIIDRNGQIVSKHVGFNEQKKLAYQQELEQLILNAN